MVEKLVVFNKEKRKRGYLNSIIPKKINRPLQDAKRLNLPWSDWKKGTAIFFPLVPKNLLGKSSEVKKDMLAKKMEKRYFASFPFFYELSKNSAPSLYPSYVKMLERIKKEKTNFPKLVKEGEKNAKKFNLTDMPKWMANVATSFVTTDAIGLSSVYLHNEEHTNEDKKGGATQTRAIVYKRPRHIFGLTNIYLKDKPNIKDNSRTEIISNTILENLVAPSIYATNNYLSAIKGGNINGVEDDTISRISNTELLRNLKKMKKEMRKVIAIASVSLFASTEFWKSLLRVGEYLSPDSKLQKWAKTWKVKVEKLPFKTYPTVDVLPNGEPFVGLKVTIPLK